MDFGNGLLARGRSPFALLVGALSEISEIIIEHGRPSTHRERVWQSLTKLLS
jgi:hypothetical protein